MKDLERVSNTINRVAPSFSSVGKNDPTALSTRDGYVYRETGLPQIYDIIECGYVRSNKKRKSNQVWWTSGGSNSFHINKKPILVASCDVVIDCNIGAIPITDLTEIWMYDEQTQTWNNKIDEIKMMYAHRQQEKNNQLQYGIEHEEKGKSR